MASNYTGSPTGVQAPDTGFAAGHAPVLSIPAGTDALSIESITQWAKVNADYLAAYAKLLNATLPVTSSALPQIRLLDAAGNGKWLFDRNGYPTGGRVSLFREEWCANPGSGASLWSNAGGAGGSALCANPNANYGARYLQLTPSSGGGGSVYDASGPKLFMSNSSWLTAVMEFELGLNTAAIGIASNVDFYAGFGTQGDASTDTNQIAIAKFHNTANYYLVTSSGGGLPQTQDTGVAPTANPNSIPIDRIKFEIYGSASPVAAYTVKLYINEVLVKTTNPSNAAAALLPVFASANIGGAPVGSPVAYMGPVSICWNRFLSGPNL